MFLLFVVFIIIIDRCLLICFTSLHVIFVTLIIGCNIFFGLGKIVGGRIVKG